MPTRPSADRTDVRRLALLALPVLALGLVPAAAAGTAKDASAWAKPQIARVVKAGLMAPDVASFRGQDPLDERALQSIVEGLNGLFAAQATTLPPPPAPPVTTTTTTLPVTTTAPAPLPATTTTTTAVAAAPPWQL